MDWHPGAGYFPLLILYFVISWVPSQELPLQEARTQEAPSKQASSREDLEKIIINLYYVAENLYVVYNTVESSLSNLTDFFQPYEPKLNLSEIWIKRSEFLKKLEKIKDFEKIFDKNFTRHIIYAINQLKNFQQKLTELDTVFPPLDATQTTPTNTFDQKRFALNTFKEFSHFMTHLFKYSCHFTKEEIKHTKKVTPCES